MMTARELDEAIREAPRSAQARERLLAHYRPFLRLIAEQSVGPALRRREDPSDIVQRTMIEATEAIDKFAGKSEAEFSAWIKQILRHNVANAVRDNRAARRDVRRENYVSDHESSATISWQLPATGQSSPSLKVIQAESALNLAHAIQNLPPEQRQAVTMRHLHGLSLAEIAEAMGKTPPAVAGLIRRGISTLRESLADETI
jgi:RNA polymerase sigma-70 factor (ECF subfamily)